MSRYDNTRVKYKKDFGRTYSYTIYPKVPIKNSDVFIITAGIPRKPGMNREDLLDINLGIMKDVADNVKKQSPDSFVIVISNPLDAMVYAFHKVSGFSKNKVVGMAGALDSGRFRSFIAEELNISPKEIQALLLGGHGDTMVPLPRYTTVSGIPINEMIDKNKLEEIIQIKLRIVIKLRIRMIKNLKKKWLKLRIRMIKK